MECAQELSFLSRLGYILGRCGCWRSHEVHVCECVCVCQNLSPSCLETKLTFNFERYFHSIWNSWLKKVSFITLNISFHYLLACIISEKSVILIDFVPLCHFPFSLLAAFKIFPFLIGSQQFDYDMAGCDLCVCMFVLLSVYQGSWIHKIELSSSLKSF